MKYEIRGFKFLGEIYFIKLTLPVTKQKREIITSAVEDPELLQSIIQNVHVPTKITRHEKKWKVWAIHWKEKNQEVETAGQSNPMSELTEKDFRVSIISIFKK